MLVCPFSFLFILFFCLPRLRFDLSVLDMHLVVSLIPSCILVFLMFSGRRSGWDGSRGSDGRWGRDPSRQIHGVSCSESLCLVAMYWIILVFFSNTNAVMYLNSEVLAMGVWLWSVMKSLPSSEYYGSGTSFYMELVFIFVCCPLGSLNPGVAYFLPENVVMNIVPL